MGKKIIDQLNSINGLKIECPKCRMESSIKRAKIFNMYDTYPAPIKKIIKDRHQFAIEEQLKIKLRKEELKINKKKKPEKITISANASNFGQIAEQIIPAFKTFPYRQRDCRILFKPIDYIVFTNLSKTGQADEIKFVDVKTGKGALTYLQKDIRDLISEGKIKHRIMK